MTNPFDLKGKVALVTGGNRGIGFGMADALAAAGADLVIWGSNAVKNEIAVEKLRAHGGRVSGATVDVADEGTVVSAFNAAVQDMGRIDAVFANAGIGGRSVPFIESTGEGLQGVLNVNLLGTYYTLREACRHMAARAAAGDPGGSLIAISTVGTESGMPGFQSYVASKGALAPLMRAIVAEHSRHGVRMNVIQAGYVDTDMTDHWRSNEAVNTSIIKSVPLRRWGKPTDFGGIAVYLASAASVYHSGNIIVIDGGYLTH
jgi:NAD(P)-dependent dehydrogenase (short-subunit alcohol dehydrogenase family)